ncbi:hypothetical protein COJ07_06660 [Bacillus cereus]|uniref:hypothetical protein n=1 Tax=Bacillus cereus TaxID=1396 RepID=UPI000BF94878|nr:hypothetical protein [Bacillus cereus]PFL23252.1 hypothetical protein COJ07_06660 [Bacillus cereus]
MLKIFKVTASEASYDEYKTIIVIAENEDRALKIAKKGQPYDWKDPDKYNVYWEFSKEQYPLIVTEIALNEEKVIISESIGD